MVWCGMAWYGLVWRGVVWCGMEWSGVVWCGIEWYGVVLPPDLNMIAMLRKSQDFMLKFWGSQNRIIGQKLGLGNMWLSSCGIVGSGFSAKLNSAKRVYFGTSVPNWDCTFNRIADFILATHPDPHIPQEDSHLFHKTNVGLESDVEVPRTSK